MNTKEEIMKVLIRYYPNFANIPQVADEIEHLFYKMHIEGLSIKLSFISGLVQGMNDYLHERLK